MLLCCKATRCQFIDINDNKVNCRDRGIAELMFIASLTLAVTVLRSNRAMNLRYLQYDCTPSTFSCFLCQWFPKELIRLVYQKNKIKRNFYYLIFDTYQFANSLVVLWTSRSSFDRFIKKVHRVQVSAGSTDSSKRSIEYRSAISYYW